MLRVGQQVSSASSFPTAMGEPVDTQLSVHSVASADDLSPNLQPRAGQEDSAHEKVLGTFKDYSFQTQGQDLASRACRTSRVRNQLLECSFDSLRYSASIRISFADCLRCFTALLCTVSLVFETLRITSFRSFSASSGNSSRSRPSTQLSNFMVILLAAGAALTVQGHPWTEANELCHQHRLSACRSLACLLAPSQPQP